MITIMVTARTILMAQLGNTKTIIARRADATKCNRKIRVTKWIVRFAKSTRGSSKSPVASCLNSHKKLKSLS